MNTLAELGLLLSSIGTSVIIYCLIAYWPARRSRRTADPRARDAAKMDDRNSETYSNETIC